MSFRGTVTGSMCSEYVTTFLTPPNPTALYGLWKTVCDRPGWSTSYTNRPTKMIWGNKTTGILICDQMSGSAWDWLHDNEGNGSLDTECCAPNALKLAAICLLVLMAHFMLIMLFHNATYHMSVTPSPTLTRIQSYYHLVPPLAWDLRPLSHGLCSLRDRCACCRRLLGPASCAF